MKCGAIIAVAAMLTGPAWAEPPAYPPLPYHAVAESFTLPAGTNMASTSGVAINTNGHIFVLNRGPQPLVEFDADGRFVRGFGEGLFDRPHGLRIDRDDNIWTTDVSANLVTKFTPEGRIALVLGVKGLSGDWHPYGHLPLFQEPTDVAIGPNGEIYVTQGHGKAVSRVLKFDKDGNYLKTWGKKGKGAGEFDGAHSIVIDGQGLLYIADRGNQRIQVFDGEGTYVRAFDLPGTPSGLYLTSDGTLWVANGHAGRVLKLDRDGKVVGSLGRQGKGLGQFGEAHFMAVSTRDELFVADTLNWHVQKFIRNRP